MKNATYTSLYQRGALLRYMVRLVGMTYADLADALGVSAQHVGHILRVETEITPETYRAHFDRIAAILMARAEARRAA